MVLLTELLPESSTHGHTYDVFLSFRGADTRNRFTDHLYNALLDADINTFLDDDDIETGEPLKPELEDAIKSSRASIIVLSKNYASSTWCLDELVLILDQKANRKQIVIPIFYDVEPTDVRKQQSSFGEAMEKHKQKMEIETQEDKRNQWTHKIELWKRALTQVADLKGKDAKEKKETEFIKEVVTDIHRRLGILLSNTLPRLVGVDRDIEFISSWLTDGSHHIADILTVVGLGGIGKTSLAKYVFQSHSNKFEKSGFVEDINRRCNESFNGLLDLQKQLHGNMSKKTKLQVNDVSMYTSKIENVLARKRVFIVLDDIGSLDQLDALLGNKGLHPGGKVIITTKDASLTQRCAIFNPQVQPKHTEVLLDGLTYSKSLELLCHHAFKSQNPKEGYGEVSKNLVKYCDGHPLALEVLGRSLQKQDVLYWKECIQVLKKEPHSRIKEALKMSIDTLPSENNKDLFKHIACFFVGTDWYVTQTILNACDINTRSGIAHLTERCLLHIEGNILMMHQLVQEVGRDLVRQESRDKPWKRTRIWCHEESLRVLKQKKSAENLLDLALDIRMLDEKKLRGSLELKTDSLSTLENLMLLQLNYVQLNGCFENFPEELRWLCMHGFPLKSIQFDLPMENLVALDMSYSNIEFFDVSYNPQQPTKRQKMLVGSCSRVKRLLGSLKTLDLSFCQQLLSIGGFFEFPALERLMVTNCISLINACESLKECIELEHIDLSYCCKLTNVPISIGKLKKVKILLLVGCNSRRSQIDMGNIDASYIGINSNISSSANIEAIPSDLKFFTTSLPSSLVRLSLEDNNLSNESFPIDFGCLSMLEELDLSDNPIVSMPGCVRTLVRLQRLFMSKCEMLVSIENPPRTLTKLFTDFIRHTVTSLRKIKFDPEMSPLNLDGAWSVLSHSSLEIDGMVKIQSMESVEGKLLHSLGWTNMEFLKEKRLKTYTIEGGSHESPTKMFYEFGIFSTLYEGKEMPNWISCRSEGSSISLTIPSSLKNLRGLNFCCTVERSPYSYFWLPLIKISNITRNQTWIYKHYIEKVRFGLGEFCLCLLSHWMFGPNEMKGGDHITVTVWHRYNNDIQVIKECGIGLVYDDEDDEKIGEEDVLSYYKSWNHIIGGDLSAFQLTTGEYILKYDQFMRLLDVTRLSDAFIEEGISYKEHVAFKAFSVKNFCRPSNVVIKEIE